MVSGDILLGSKTIKKLKEVTPIKVKVVIRSSSKKKGGERWFEMDRVDEGLSGVAGKVPFIDMGGVSLMIIH